MEIYFICGVFIGLFIFAVYSHFRANRKQQEQDQAAQVLIAENQRMIQDNQRLQNDCQKLAQDNQKIQSEKEQLLVSKAEVEKDLAQMQVEFRHATEKILQSKSETEKNLQVLSEKFENLAQKIFEEKSQKFSDQNLSHLKMVLDPLRDQMKTFEKRIEDSYSTERVERGTLKGEISKLIDLNRRMSTETENLTKALKGDQKTQGYWGELILETILERSGLRKDEEYFLQGGGLVLRNKDNSLYKPDVLLRLPEQKYIVIDAKVSLTAFERFMNLNESQPEESSKAAQEHLDSVKRHIDTLGAKKYHDLDQLQSPEMTLLFMPIESAFALALKTKSDLLQYAWDQQVVLVSPSTLLSTLKTIASIWKQEKQNKNTLEIAKAGGQLYEKFCGLMEDLHLIGQRIEQTHDAYQSAVNKLGQGKGNLIKQVERLKLLGAKTEKNLLDTKISQKLIEDNDEISAAPASLSSPIDSREI